MVDPLTTIVSALVNGMFLYTLGSPMLVGIFGLAALAYIIVRTHMDRSSVALIGLLGVGIVVWAGWVPAWVWGVLVLVSAIVVGFAVIRMGGGGDGA